MKLESFLQKTYGYNPEVKDSIKTYIEQWKSWYVGNVRSFHNYFIYNGQKKVNKKRFTLNMAKEVSEDWSDILWSEKCKVSMKNEESQKQFDELVDKLDLYTIINQAIEKSGAVGTEATVTSVYDIVQNEDQMMLDVSNAKTRVDIVDIDWVYPLTWNNKEITECAFGSVEYKNGIKYIILSVHKLNDQGNYVIKNHLFRETNGNLMEITTDETVAEFDTQSSTKWFSIFKPLLTNNLFANNPFGIPHYANAIDVLKTIDIDFDAFKNEVKDGRRRTFARAELFNYDSGEQKLVFDPNDTDLYVLPKGANADDLLQSDSSNLRVGDQVNALNKSLNMLSNKVGLGDNFYTFDGAQLSTATAVMSSNSKLARRMKKLQIGYESSIYDLIKSVCYASSQFGNYNIDTEDMAIQFDDGVIEDKEAESVRALREFNAGLISGAEYRQRVLGETQEVAEKRIKEIQEEQAEQDETKEPEEDDKPEKLPKPKGE